MKTGKILIVMIFAALGFTANAQRGVQANYNNHNSVRQYTHLLNLSPSQVRDWSELNRYYEDKFHYVRSDRNLSPRARSKRLDNLYNEKDRDLKRILNKRQYRKFSTLKSNNRYTRPTRTYRNTTRYNSYSNSNYGPTYSCPSNGSRRTYRN